MHKNIGILKSNASQAGFTLSKLNHGILRGVGEWGLGETHELANSFLMLWYSEAQRTLNSPTIERSKIMARKMNLILLGAPGAGKGTQAEIISAKYNIPAISTGAILREEIASGSELGENVKSYTSAGNLVPDAIIIDILKNRIAKDDCKGGFILDGFPRTVPQAAALDEMGVEITDVISIEVADEDIMERMSGRRVCPKCGLTFHTKFKPSPNGENCPCGEKLTIRADDDPEVVKSRLVIYHDQTEPLKDFYEKKGLLKIVYGQEKLEDTTALTCKALEG